MPFSIVTGANRGIGLALAAELKGRAHTVLAACRKTSPALDALGVEVLAGVEVSEAAGIERLRKAVGERKIDLLINNAGILVWGDRLGELDVDGIRRQFEVNALAPLLITNALRDRLGKGSKVGLVTSRMGSIDDNTLGRWLRLPHEQGRAEHGRQVAGHRLEERRASPSPSCTRGW